MTRIFLRFIFFKLIQSFADYDNYKCFFLYFFLNIEIAGGDDVWIAGSDSIEEGKWRWFGSGQTWSYTNWNKGKTTKHKTFFVDFF